MSATEPSAALRREYADTREQHAAGGLRVVLVDDNVEFVERVANVLAKDFEIVGKFYDGESFLRKVPQLKPDVIVLDISMGELSGIKVAQRLKQSKCSARIVFLSVHEGSEFISAALAAGASGYFFKNRLGTISSPRSFPPALGTCSSRRIAPNLGRLNIAVSAVLAVWQQARPSCLARVDGRSDTGTRKRCWAPKRKTQAPYDRLA